MTLSIQPYFIYEKLWGTKIEKILNKKHGIYYLTEISPNITKTYLNLNKCKVKIDYIPPCE